MATATFPRRGHQPVEGIAGFDFTGPRRWWFGRISGEDVIVAGFGMDIHLSIGRRSGSAGLLLDILQ